ncbi:major facilitator superfamily domain-containing protein 12-like isoform X1 [Clavelina lepadiformis]|uniref:major facilitator superfamily domain-containing protein 12-like isoform X1 n=1 Tax=Clavelina lepadiformis TaxID=159417 RepID=UPI00404138DD
MVLSGCQKFAYSVGHVLNDLCASMWFSYLLVFFHKILQFSNSMSGYILLVGQIADGIATPFVGYESDKSSITCKYGRRKSWHLVGTICVTLTFPLLYMHCIGCSQTTAEYAQFVYYAPLVVIFQFGWASTQINHLALIPDLTNDDGDKVTLNAFRYAFTVFSSILVYGIAWLVLDLPGSTSNGHELSPIDAPSFRNLVLSVVGIGIVFSGIFHFVLKEPPRTAHASPGLTVNGPDETETLLSHGDQGLSEKTTLLRKQTSDTVTSTSNMLHWYQWFKKLPFYQMAMLYMCTRLVVNLSQVYLPMFLTDTLKMHKKFIAIVPLIAYLSSFLAALLVRPISKIVRQEVMYFWGAAFVVSSCVWGNFIPEQSMQIFGQAILLGFGNSIILIISLSMTARLIGKETATGAFVYGAMSLTDKISNGIAVVVIQNLNPCKCNCPLCAIYFRTVMTYVIGGIMLVAVVTLFITAITRKNEPLDDGRRAGTAEA